MARRVSRDISSRRTAGIAGVGVPPLLTELFEALLSRSDGRRLVDRAQLLIVCCDGLKGTARRDPGDVAWRPFKRVSFASFATACLTPRRDSGGRSPGSAHPLLSALIAGRAEPQAQNVTFAVHVHADRHVTGRLATWLSRTLITIASINNTA